MYDVAVVGAGPAGLAAARAAADAGLAVALIDGADRVGGQYHRHPPPSLHVAGPDAPHAPHQGGNAFAELRDAVAAHPGIDLLLRHRVWIITPDLTVHATVGEREQRPVRLRARSLVVATGAYDRPLPFPGWDLPGVMTAGAAQALLKGNLVVAGRRIVVSGTGPFLLPVAVGLAAAGTRVAGVFEANHPNAAAFRLAAYPSKLLEGAGLGAALLRHRIPYRTGHAVIAAHGDAAVEAVTVARLDSGWRPIPGSERLVECDAVAVGYGFTPQLDLALQLGCDTRIDSDGNLVVKVDAAQRTSIAGVFAVGETTGIGGAQLAEAEGRLAALSIACRVGRRVDHAAAREAVRRRRRMRAFAGWLRATFPVRDGWMDWLRDDTLVCRCEEVPYGTVRQAATELGATDPRTVKLLTRAGMGWCQGRICGHSTACLATRATGRPLDADGLRGIAHRPFAVPVLLGQLANGRDESAANRRAK